MAAVGLEKNDAKFIQPDKVYVIKVGGQRIIRRLYFKDANADTDEITCVADYTTSVESGPPDGKLEFSSFSVLKKDIANIYNVTCVAKREVNSRIFHHNHNPLMQVK